ncbi:MAG TPA: SDR family NAD(P)-dependent oxidoreductase [Syntrophorhabdaceae bacterium]|jgi:NAD(P)-dependent dehydrogenase (short-subunit alcohol dehydrogenase family)|nr:SDR family NAD(P)-dependent oxidoreductase [Syntrophorhabdaceae bacterium]
MYLEGKVAIVTGAARGIGKAIAEKLASEGAFVYLADVNVNGVRENANVIQASGWKAEGLAVDITKSESIIAMVDHVIEASGKIDILVNNAGIFGKNKPIDQISIEEWDTVIAVNLRGTHMCSQAVVKKMTERRYGKIVNIGSMSAQTGGLKAGVDYTASKGGIMALTKAYARYGARLGITANTVVPGFILTDMTRSWAEKDGAGNDIPMGRIGTVQDVANVVFFLASPLSDYVTGQVVNVNGGMVMSN